MAIGKLPDADLEGSEESIFAEINVTPLTDIFLVLLIIFMVTSVAMVQSGANINLPQVEETNSEPRQIVITVTPQKEIFVNNTPTTLAETGSRRPPPGACAYHSGTRPWSRSSRSAVINVPRARPCSCTAWRPNSEQLGEKSQWKPHCDPRCSW